MSLNTNQPLSTDLIKKIAEDNGVKFYSPYEEMPSSVSGYWTKLRVLRANFLSQMDTIKAGCFTDDLMHTFHKMICDLSRLAFITNEKQYEKFYNKPVVGYQISYEDSPEIFFTTLRKNTKQSFKMTFIRKSGAIDFAIIGYQEYPDYFKEAVGNFFTSGKSVIDLIFDILWPFIDKERYRTKEGGRISRKSEYKNDEQTWRNMNSEKTIIAKQEAEKCEARNWEMSRYHSQNVRYNYVYEENKQKESAFKNQQEDYKEEKNTEELSKNITNVNISNNNLAEEKYIKISENSPNCSTADNFPRENEYKENE